MTGNLSSAVRQQRSEAHDSLDDFPTPPWAGRALCEWLAELGYQLPRCSVHEPAANRGFLVRALRDYFYDVTGSDVHDYGAGFGVADYLFGGDDLPVDWTITNPPFRLAEQFIFHALERSVCGVAMLVRSAFVEGIGRYERLFSVRPPTDILQFCERVPMVRGRYDAKASSATAYCWLVWDLAEEGRPTRFHWIEACRARLETPGDLELSISKSGVEADDDDPWQDMGSLFE